MNTAVNGPTPNRSPCNAAHAGWRRPCRRALIAARPAAWNRVDHLQPSATAWRTAVTAPLPRPLGGPPPSTTPRRWPGRPDGTAGIGPLDPTVRSSERSLYNRTFALASRTASGGIQLSGSRPDTSSSNRSSVSVRSVLARRFFPRNAATSARSATWATPPIRATSSATYRHPVQPSMANSTRRRRLNWPSHTLRCSRSAGQIRPRETSPSQCLCTCRSTGHDECRTLLRLPRGTSSSSVICDCAVLRLNGGLSRSSEAPLSSAWPAAWLLRLCGRAVSRVVDSRFFPYPQKVNTS